MELKKRRPRVPHQLLDIWLQRKGMKPSPLASGISFGDIDAKFDIAQNQVVGVYKERPMFVIVPPDQWPEESMPYIVYPRAAFRDPLTSGDEIIFLWTGHGRMNEIKIKKGKKP